MIQGKYRKSKNEDKATNKNGKVEATIVAIICIVIVVLNSYIKGF